MKIAILHNGSDLEDGNISFVLNMLCDAFIGLGHKVIYVEASQEQSATCLLKQSNVEAIFVYKFRFKNLHKIASYLKIPVIDSHWCYSNLSSLLNSRNETSRNQI